MNVRRTVLLCLLAAVPLHAPAAPPPAPGFVGIQRWINAPPQQMQALRGKVVLVDFWAFRCINCLHAIPHLNRLYQQYRGRGLVVIGVHTPELAEERDRAGLIHAVRRLEIDYPVAQDNRRATWNAWGTRYWPTQYLVDRRGRVVYKHIGEGDYDTIEQAVRQLLDQPPPATVPAPR